MVVHNVNVADNDTDTDTDNESDSDEEDNEIQEDELFTKLKKIMRDYEE